MGRQQVLAPGFIFPVSQPRLCTTLSQGQWSCPDMLLLPAPPWPCGEQASCLLLRPQEVLEGSRAVHHVAKGLGEGVNRAWASIRCRA